MTSDYARCPACGDPIDYCTGHGPIGDPVGADILARHDAGEHDACNVDGCDDASTPAADILKGATVYRWNEYLPTDDAPSVGETVGTYGLHVGDSPTGSDVPTYLEVPYTAWGDYVGSSVERANALALWDDYAPHLIRVRGDYGSEWLIVPSGASIPRTLADILTGLADYPLVSDDALGVVETDLESDDLSSWLVWDIRREMGDAGEQWSDDDVTAAYWRARLDGLVEWWPESAVGGWTSPDPAGIARLILSTD
jgi:hypothetical protein